MKKLTLALATATALISAPALAADLGRMPARAPVMAPAPAYGMWNGFYIGLNIGYGAGVEDTGVLDSFSAAFLPNFLVGQLPADFAIRRDGVVGGGQIGYNFQAGAFVGGIEADIQGSGIGGTSTINFAGLGPFVPVTSTATSDLDWFGTVRGRVGVAFSQVLLYATGGFAYGGIEDTVSWVANPTVAGNFFGRTQNIRTGYTVGGGLEFAFSPNWSLKAEYLFLDLGTSTTTMTDAAQFPGISATYGFDHRYHIGRIGVNYKFGGPGPVVASY